ncbi:F-box domain-containing protein [Mycena chlorophos]|uniref:F-box domain-containing protein n=1 Tax=Mycena chlorophos TaxID=658473 RepID=A0A8H6W498_MYCCL|nr:F-box domain-containing protein [Mycena chlorophos]
MTGLLDLPNELLVVICSSEAMFSEDLFRLALVCHRLHPIALHAFFALTTVGFGVESRSLTVQMLTSGPDALSGLCAALFPLPPIEELFIALPRVLSPTQIVYTGWNETKYLPMHLRRIEAFFKRFIGRAALKMVKIQLDEYRTDMWSGASESARADAAQHFKSCFNAVLGAGCETLAVHNGGFYLGSTPVPPAEPQVHERESAGVANIGTKLRRLFRTRQSKDNKSKDKIDKPQSSSLPTNSRLVSFDIGSNVLLSPEMVDWTTGVLRSSPITHLVFSAMTCGSTFYRLLQIAVARPGITSFSLRDAEFMTEFDHIPVALDCYTKLVHLSISGRHIYLNIPPHFHLFLPYLETIRAPPLFIIGLLSRRSPWQIPRLKAVYVSWSKNIHDAGSGLEHMYDLRVLAASVSEVTNLLDQHKLRPIIGIKTEGALWQQDTSSQFTFEDLSPELQSILKRVSALEISLFMMPGDLDFIQHWTRLFPSAKQAKIELGDRFFDSEWNVSVEHLGREIRRRTQLEKVELNGKHFNFSRLAKE